jgi:hypothetical protein
MGEGVKKKPDAPKRADNKPQPPPPKVEDVQPTPRLDETISPPDQSRKSRYRLS